jgi:hypothetical protein
MANRRMPARKCCMRAQICSHSVPQPSVRCSQQRFESVISVCGCRDRKNQMCIEMLRHRGADIRREESYLSKRTIGCAHRTSPLCHAKLECSPRQAQAAEIIGRLSLSPLASPSCHAAAWADHGAVRTTPTPPARRSSAGQRLPPAQTIVVASLLCAHLAPAGVARSVWRQHHGGRFCRRAGRPDWRLDRGDGGRTWRDHANDSADETAVDLDL